VLGYVNCREVQADGVFLAGESMHPQPRRVYVLEAAVRSDAEVSGVGVLHDSAEAFVVLYQPSFGLFALRDDVEYCDEIRRFRAVDRNGKPLAECLDVNLKSVRLPR